MNLSNNALNFTIDAFDKFIQPGISKHDKHDEILHCMLVGDLLRSLCFEEDIVAAGYLHSIPELTSITVNDLGKRFKNGHMTRMILTAKEPSATLPSEIKKQKAKAIKDMALPNVAVILADLIARIEMLRIRLPKNINTESLLSDYFEALGLGNYQDLKAYYEDVFNALSKNYTEEEYENRGVERLLWRLRDNIQSLFYNDATDWHLKPPVISEDLENAQFRNEITGLKQMRKAVTESKPYVFIITNEIERGTPTIKQVFNSFLKGNGLKLSVTTPDYDATSIVFDSNKPTPKIDITLEEVDLLIGAGIDNTELEKATRGEDVVLVGNGLFDRLVRIKSLFTEDDMDKFDEYLDYYGDILDANINSAAVTYYRPARRKINNETVVLTESIQHLMLLLNRPKNQ